MNQHQSAPKRQWLSYQTIWRWHFYAGLFCIPFVVVLAITGAIYLFKPQVEATLNQPYQQLAITGHVQTAEAQINAALAAVPNAAFNAYQLPETQQSAVQILLKQQGSLMRVYVHPQTLAVLNIVREDDRLMHIVHELHGNLLVGDWGSYLVELAASWAIVMLITGLYLWWPKHTQSLAGIVYPRLNSSQRVFWRDLHAVTGFWIAFFTLFLLVSGLPWAKSWGGLLKEIRQINTSKVVVQDWTTGPASASAVHSKLAMPNMSDAEHAGHMQHMQTHQPQHDEPMDYRVVNQLIATVQPLNLAYPVLISPPSARAADWTAKSNAQNRPLRAEIVLDAKTGAIKSRKNFADRPWLDRVIGYGIAIHEGQLFGWFNQLLGLLTALGLVLISVSGVILWWRRRAPNVLGAPNSKSSKTAEPTVSTYVLWLMIILLATLLPLMGMTLLLVLLLERFVLRHITPAKNFLGLR